MHTTILYPLLHTAIAFLMCASCVYCMLQGKYRKVSSVETLIIYMCTSCEMLRAIFILSHYIMHRTLLHDVLVTMQKLELYFLVHMKHRLPYGRFFRQFTIKASIAIISYVAYLMLYALRCWSKNYFSTVGTQLRVLLMCTVFSTLYITFYVHTLNFHLHELNAVVVRDMAAQNNRNTNKNHNNNNNINYGNSHSSRYANNSHMHPIQHKSTTVASSMLGILLRNKIKCYKNVHFRLWESSEKLNTSFGWIMMAIVMQHFFVFVYSAVWIFLEIHGKSSTLFIIRETMQYSRI